MEQLALFALPRSYKDKEAEGKSNEAAAAAGSNASSIGWTGKSTLSWRSNLSVAATQDQAVPNLGSDEALTHFGDAAYMNTSKSSLHAWSSSLLTARPAQHDPGGMQGSPMSWTTWTGGANGQECFNQGEICIHGGFIKGVKGGEFTYVIDMSEGKGIVSTVDTVDHGPSPRLYAAAVAYVDRNAFIVFGGNTLRPADHLGTRALYWLDMSRFLGFQ